ncbi:MAG: hypothetical protein ABI661_10475 [Gammaproteobacteria bacterium]
MRSFRSFVATAAIAASVAAAGCSTGDIAVGPGEQPPVVTALTCTVNGVVGPCTLPVSADIGSFDVVLTGLSCDAHGNRLRVTQPLQSELTDDACYMPIGKKWMFSGTYPGGTAIDIAIVSAPLPNPSALRATGSYPQWTLEFEDGGDSDFNDVVLTVTAHPKT